MICHNYMALRENTLHITLYPISRGRNPVTLTLSEMQSFPIHNGGAVFLSPIQGWRAHFHSDEASIKDAVIGAPLAERVAKVPTRSRRREDAATHVEAWLLEQGTQVDIIPAGSGTFMYKRRKFPKMTIEVV